jgi:hypothetical protein
MSIVTLDMRTDKLQSTGVDNRSVPADVIVITDAMEATAAMF